MPARVRKQRVARRKRSKEHEKTVLLPFRETVSPGEVENAP